MNSFISRVIFHRRRCTKPKRYHFALSSVMFYGDTALESMQSSWRCIIYAPKTVIMKFDLLDFEQNLAHICSFGAYLILTATILSYFFYWLYSPLGPWPLLFSFMIILQTVGLIGWVISSLQGLYLNTGQHKQNKHIQTPNIHALCGIRTQDPSFRASEDSSCLRPLSYCDRHFAALYRDL
jgi:hypothetical protein